MKSLGQPLLPSRLAVKKATAAKLLECSIDTVDRLIARGHLPSVRLGSGRAIRIPLPALEEFIQNQTTTMAKGTQDK
jgi:excisionase family DNA binding protein